MKNLKTTLYGGFFLVAAVAFTSCTQNKNSDNESKEVDSTEMMEKNHHEEGEAPEHGEVSGEERAHEHGSHDEMIMEMGGNKTWIPSGSGAELIQSDFHFISGSAENIKPEVKLVNGSAVLELNADGTPVAFVFHNQYDNIGMIAALKKLDFLGTISVIHHAKDLSNYEFVSIDGSNMKLGRVVNGKEEVFDESEFAANSDWMSLKVTAAGTHYKGYMDDKNITHGHGDKMEKGFVGIMLEGKGKVQIKSIEIAVLENE